MFLKVFLFILIAIYSVNSEYFDHLKKRNSKNSKLIEVRVPKNFVYERNALLKGVFEIKENGTTKKIEDNVNHEFRQLYLDEIKIEDIERGAFKSLNNIRKITLSHNKLKIIKNYVFDNIKCLDELDLSYNEISTIEEDAFDNMPHIIFIELTGNKIVKLNGNWFKNSPKLTGLLLNDNEIQEISADDFKNLRGIHTSFEKQHGLSLWLGYNKINKIHPDAFKGIPLIGHLNLRRNALQELPEKLFKGVIVENMDIGENNISCTPKEVYNATLMFNSNPPICT